MQGFHPLFCCPLFVILCISVPVSGTRLLPADCWYHKCQACMERCNLSSHPRRPVEPTVLLHTVQISRRGQDAAADMEAPWNRQHRNTDHNIWPFSPPLLLTLSHL